MESVICHTAYLEIKLAIDFSIAGPGQLSTPMCRILLLRDGAIPSGKFSLPLFNEEHEKDVVVSLTHNIHAFMKLSQCCQARNYCPLLITNKVQTCATYPNNTYELFPLWKKFIPLYFELMQNIV